MLLCPPLKLPPLLCATKTYPAQLHLQSLSSALLHQAFTSLFSHLDTPPVQEKGCFSLLPRLWLKQGLLGSSSTKRAHLCPLSRTDTLPCDTFFRKTRFKREHKIPFLPAIYEQKNLLYYVQIPSHNCNPLPLRLKAPECLVMRSTHLLHCCILQPQRLVLTSPWGLHATHTLPAADLAQATVGSELSALHTSASPRRFARSL